jgi:hypothetical protein
MHRTLIPMLLALAAGADPAMPAREACPRTVRATGVARVSAPPDVAVVTVGVQVVGTDLEKAAADEAAQTRRVLTALRRQGIAEKDIQTVRHDVEPQRPWENGRPGRITGYAVSDDLRVTVRDLDKLESLLGRVVAAGSNALRGVSFEKEDLTPAKARALALAVTNARTKAEAMAKAAGVQIGEVVSVSEGAGPGSFVPASMMAGAERFAAPVAAGEVEVVVSADVVFGIR